MSGCCPGSRRRFSAAARRLPRDREALGAGRSIVLMRSSHSGRTGGRPPAGFRARGRLSRRQPRRSPGAYRLETDPVQQARLAVRARRSGARVRDTPGYLARVPPGAPASTAARRACEHAADASRGKDRASPRPSGRLHVHELPTPGAEAHARRFGAAAKIADVLVVVSEAVAALVRPHAGATPVLVAYNGVPAARRPHASRFTGTVGTIGTVCRTKGTDLFLEAAALAHERRPSFASSTSASPAWTRTSSSSARSCTRGNRSRRRRLSMLGRRPAVEGLIAGSSSSSPPARTLFRSRSLEAMAAGVPVIATALAVCPSRSSTSRPACS